MKFKRYLYTTIIIRPAPHGAGGLKSDLILNDQHADLVLPPHGAGGLKFVLFIKLGDDALVPPPTGRVD